MNYQTVYNQVWSAAEYHVHSPEVVAVPKLLELCQNQGFKSTIAFGCGQGHGVARLNEAGLDAYGLDVSSVAVTAHPELEQKIKVLDITKLREAAFGQIDLVYSIDVLEHIHPDDLHGFFSAALAQKPKMVYFEIATKIDSFGPQLVGEHLHVCVRPPEWWKAVISDYFKVREFHQARASHVTGFSLTAVPRKVVGPAPKAWTPSEPSARDRRRSRNLQALIARGFPTEAGQLIESEEIVPENAGLIVKGAPTGEPFAAVRMGEQFLALEDPKDPVSKARDEARAQKLGESPTLLMQIGLGLGYRAEKVLSLLPAQSHLLVVEPFPEALRMALEERDLRELFADSRFHLLLCNDEDGLRLEVAKLMREYPRLCTMLPWVPESYAALLGELAFTLTKTSLVMFERVQRERQSLYREGMTWAKQSLQNMPWAITHPGTEAFDGVKDMDSAIIVGAGPTLADSFEFLRAMQERVPIFAADSAVPRLVAAGVHPHLVLAVDPKEAPMKSASKLDPEKSGLVLSDQVHPNYANMPAAFKVLCLNEFWQKEMRSVYPKRKSWRNMMFVGGTAVQLAEALGAKKMYLVGLDFAFAPDGSTHVAGALPQNLMDRHTKDECKPLAGYETESLKTSNIFRLYMDEFCEYVEASPELEFIPVTTGGARIGNLQHVRPEKALAFAEQHAVHDWRQDLKSSFAAAQTPQEFRAQQELLSKIASEMLRFRDELYSTDNVDQLLELFHAIDNTSTFGICAYAIQDILNSMTATGEFAAAHIEALRCRFDEFMPLAHAALASSASNLKARLICHPPETPKPNELPRLSAAEHAAFSIERIERAVEGATAPARLRCAIVSRAEESTGVQYDESRSSILEAFTAQGGSFKELGLIRVDAAQFNQARAHNLAVELAAERGFDWLFFLEAGDTLASNVFADTAAWLDKLDALWGSNWKRESGQAEPVRVANQRPNITSLAMLMATDPEQALQIGHFVRTSVARKYPWREDLATGAEYEYFLRVWEHERCRKVAQPFFYSHAGKSHESAWRAQVERSIQECAQRLKLAVDLEINGIKLRFFTPNPFDQVQHQHLNGTLFDAARLDFMKENMPPLPTIVDVGANVGNHALYFEKFIHPHKVVVIEPNPASVKVCRKNAELNNCTTFDFTYTGVAAGPGRGRYKLASGTQGAEIEVEMRPLDEMLKGKVDFVRVGTHKFGLEVLAGMRRIMREFQPVIFIEIHKDKKSELAAFLQESSHEMHREIVDGDKLNLILAAKK